MGKFNTISIILILLLFTNIFIYSQSIETNPLYTTGIVVLDNGDIAMSNKGSKDVRVYDKEMKLLWSEQFNFPVTSIVADKNNIYLTYGESIGYTSSINIKTRKRNYEVMTGFGVMGATLSPDNKRLYICNSFSNNVSELDAQSGKLLRTVAVLREPTCSVITPDGKYLFVANHLPQQRADIDFVAADVSVIQLSSFKKIKDIKLDNGSNALRGISMSPDGKYVYVSHNLGRYQVPTSQLQQGWMNTNAMSVIDVATLSFKCPLLLDDSDRGAAGIWDIACDKENIIISHSGTHEVSIVKHKEMIDKLKEYNDLSVLSYDLYFMKNIRKRVKLDGNGPREIFLKGDKVYVPTYFSDTLNIIDINTHSVHSFAYNPNRKESDIDKGEKIFNDATYCYQNWQSCNGCHPGDGRTDGLNWDLMNDGIGNPKNCKSLLFSHITNPNMISGIRATAELAVRAGFKHIQFSEISEEDALCVDEYLKNLKPVSSPYLINGKLSQKALAGEKIYKKLGCDNCHSGPLYTDLNMYRIGDNIEFEAGWDTPTLREVWRTAPYLFDGRAASMKDVFLIHKHGVNVPITEKEAEELAEYVNSL